MICEVRVDREDHVTGDIDDSVGWTGCKVVKELIDDVVHVLCSGILLLTKFTEGNNKFVVHSMGVVEQGPNQPPVRK